MVFISRYISPLGGITLASDGETLTGLWFDGQKYFGDNLPDAYHEAECPVFGLAKRWLDTYFAGQQPDFTPPLTLRGSPFRLAVWEQLMRISYGQVTTYGAIAAQLAAQQGGKRVSAQAVGGAVGHNPVSIIVPCHRVVGSSGSLTGYAGGVDKKAALLRLEGADMGRLFVPQKGSAL